MTNSLGGFCRNEIVFMKSASRNAVIFDAQKRFFHKKYSSSYCKKRTGTPSFCTLLISILLLDSNDSTFFSIYFCQFFFVYKRYFGSF